MANNVYKALGHLIKAVGYGLYSQDSEEIENTEHHKKPSRKKSKRKARGSCCFAARGKVRGMPKEESGD